jgi:uncharacterized protein (DUF2236 family)
MTTSRPIAIAPDEAQPADDGLFGPESVTWRVTASPVTSIGAGAAVLVQMLHPRVMRLIDQASRFREDWEGCARMTGEYTLTITYGDTAAAEQAGAVLRRIHSRRTAVDPINGERYAADEPDLLMWVHCALVWSLLRAYQRWGPALTPTEWDRYVDEQRVAARLVGIDPALAPASVAELDAYMERMRPHLAYVVEAKDIRDMVVPPKLPFTPKGLTQLVLSRAAVDLLTPEQPELYGFRLKWANHAAVQTGATLLVGLAKAKVPYEKFLPQLRAQVQTHAFGGKTKRREAPATTAAASDD